MRRFAAMTSMAILFLSAAAAGGGNVRPVSAGGSAPGQSAAAPLCGLDSPAFCDTFDKPMGTGNRSGQLDGTVWGVSRTTQNVNPGQGILNSWTPSAATSCNTAPLLPQDDVQVCNGRLVEAVNDLGKNVTILAMYPKQPFDIAGRTGKVTFDVNADSQGNHAIWPAFVYTDLPVPAPSGDALPAEDAVAQNSFGFTLAGLCDAGQNLHCGNCSNQDEMTVDSAFVTRHFALTNVGVEQLGCVQRGSASALNHFEVDISESGATISGTQPGTQEPLIPLASITATMPLTRGLIWIEDVHYNGCKFNSQCTHTFVWDNVGFDGPLLPRDLSFDVMDNGARDSDGSQNLGWKNPAGLETMPQVKAADLKAASAALLTLNWFPMTRDSITYSVNGHADHQQSWPFPDGKTYVWRTVSLAVPLTELQEGTNTVSVSTSEGTAVANIDLKLVGAGGVPCAPGTHPPCAAAPATASTASPPVSRANERTTLSAGTMSQPAALRALARLSSWWSGNALLLR
jgi:hypothetical protein